MPSTDPIADMLTCIRNANMRRYENTTLPWSKQKENICNVLKEEGYIRGYSVTVDPKLGEKKKYLTILLKYGPEDEFVIRGIKRLSTPGRRVYVSKDEIPRVQSGFGIAVISTSKGMMSSRRAKHMKVGGELICSVW